MFSRETLLNVLPFLMLWSLLAGVNIAIGKRKGVAPALSILGSFPLWVAFYTFWLIRLPVEREKQRIGVGSLHNARLQIVAQIDRCRI